RVRAMTLSVFTYAAFSGLCGFASSPAQIAALRFLSALGMGGEWALGVALVMEIWPDQSRAVLAGLIGAAANVGYLLVAVLVLALAVMALGYLYPVWRYLRRAERGGHLAPGQEWPTVRRMLLGACLGGIPLLATWAAIQWASVWADHLSERATQQKLYPALAA